MHQLNCGTNSLLHSVNLIVFTLLLAHLILRIISPHHSHHLRSHHLSLTPELKVIYFTNPFLHSHFCSFRRLAPPYWPLRFRKGLYFTTFRPGSIVTVSFRFSPSVPLPVFSISMPLNHTSVLALPLLPGS